VNVHSHAVSEAVAELLAVPGRPDDVARHRIQRPGANAGAHRVERLLLG
jgi:hypothetical protein